MIMDQPDGRLEHIGAFLVFLQNARRRLRDQMVAKAAPQVQHIGQPREGNYVGDQGKLAMYQKFESVIYDDARAMVTLWQFFDEYERKELRQFQRLTALGSRGRKGDRHPRNVFDRLPLGVAALIVGTVVFGRRSERLDQRCPLRLGARRHLDREIVRGPLVRSEDVQGPPAGRHRIVDRLSDRTSFGRARAGSLTRGWTPRQ